MQIEGNQSEDLDKYEALRLILESEQARSVTYSEAHEVGDGLINFFEVLADDTYLIEQAELELMV